MSSEETVTRSYYPLCFLAHTPSPVIAVASQWNTSDVQSQGVFSSVSKLFRTTVIARFSGILLSQLLVRAYVKLTARRTQGRKRGFQSTDEARRHGRPRSQGNLAEQCKRGIRHSG